MTKKPAPKKKFASRDQVNTIKFPRDAIGTLADIQAIAVDDEMSVDNILDELWTMLERYRRANPKDTAGWGMDEWRGK
ncbi:MAG TPA: hypothetical protein VI172_00830 [Candidatus Dormibacteraeota bacterium]|jgi:hypothetical protein